MASRSPRILLGHDENRKRLFRKSKPLIRAFTGEDLWLLWAAYKEGSFAELPPDWGKAEFNEWILRRMSGYGGNLLIEDYNPRFKDKRGAIGLVSIRSEGSRIEPTAVFFKWATKSNVLRASVRFFNWVRYRKEVGVCVVTCLKGGANLLHHVKGYGVLHYVGKIVGGDPRGGGNEYLFSVQGGKK